MLMEVEEQLISVLKDNVGTWFNNKYKVAAVDDMFPFLFAVDKEWGSLFRFKQEHAKLTTGLECKLTLHMKAIKFHKDVCTIIWNVLEVTAEEPSPKFIETDSDSDQEEIGPSADELVTMKDVLHISIDTEINSIETRLRDLCNMKQQLKSLDCTLHDIDNIHERANNRE